MSPTTRLHPDTSAGDGHDDTVQCRLDGHDSQFASIQATLQAILARLEASPASSALTASGGCASSADGGSLLGTPPSPQLPWSVPLSGRSTLTLDIPHFSSIDPMGWIAKEEQYFDLHLTPEADNVGTTMVSLDESTLHWAQRLRQSQPLISWAEMKQEMIHRYDHRYAGSAVEHYLGFFMQGLLPSIRSRLHTHQPRTVSDALDLARVVEAYLGARPPVTIGPPLPRPPPPRDFGPRQPPPRDFGPRPPPPGGPRPSRTPTPHRISNGDYNELRRKGLYFRCRQPYSPTHVYVVKEFCAIIGDFGPEITVENFEALELSDEPQPPESYGATFNRLDLPCFLVGGLTGPRTMKLAGLVQGHPVLIMIDSGASHNFISHRLVQHLSTPYTPSSNFTVCLGDGRRRPTAGPCSVVRVTTGPCAVTTYFYVFELGGVDIILGVAWLETLGDVKVN